ncbi:MAG: ubiB [Gammaproteobacteria bacterium]|jgi:ubiquinone biosynthesis protein|nr:ubiB [Gammaproteobacteria bacterium]
MHGIRQVFRLIHIYWICLCYGLDEFFFQAPWLRPFRFLARLNIFRLKHRNKPRGVRIRLALEKLGPIFIKFGQTLSTRRDLLPDDIALELAKLQDKVPPFSSAQARRIIETSLQKKIEDLFKSFNNQPLAAASIAQVHEAELWDGQKVIVKVLRPQVEVSINRDLDLLYFLARGVKKYISVARLLRPVEVVQEFDQIIHDELDLQREAANASQLRRNFDGSNLLYVPEIYWDYVRQKVLVMEMIHGIPISDLESLRAHGINMKALAERGVEIFFTQVFRDSFFHADMHPGNIFVDPNAQEMPRYLGVDFGIMGTLSSADQRYLAENLLAFFHRDYRRVAELHVESGWVPKNTRVDQLEAAIRTVCEPIFEKPLSEISFGQMLLKLFQTARRFHMTVQPQLVLLQKTLFNVEGLGRQLYPDLDLWSTAKPYLEDWMKQQMGIKAFVKKVKANLPYWLEKMPDMPDLIYQRLKQDQRDVQNTLLLSHEVDRLKAQNQTMKIGIALLLVFVVVLCFWRYF